MKLTFFRKFIATVSLRLAFVIGIWGTSFSNIVFASYAEYEDGRGGILRHWYRTRYDSANDSKAVSAETQCHRHGEYLGSYTRTYFTVGYFGGGNDGSMWYDSGRRYSSRGQFSHAESKTDSGDKHLTACTNCGPEDA